MADQKKTPFPMLPVKHWWALRKRFKQSIPGTVTDSYLATVLNMEVKSARANVLPYLEIMGIIDEEGKTLDRAKQWRDDAQYADVCKEVVGKVYPADLLEAVPGPNVDRKAATRWFANHTGAGSSAVARMVGTYTYLVQGDPAAEPDTKSSSEGAKSKAQVPKKKVSRKEKKPSAELNAPHAEDRLQSSPEININLQIHISSDATPDQIDKIFESMAKHIYKKG